MTNNRIVSLWLPEIVRVMGVVRWVMVANLRLSNAFTVRGLSRSLTGRKDCFTSDSSMKLSSAPVSAYRLKRELEGRREAYTDERAGA